MDDNDDDDDSDDNGSDDDDDSEDDDCDDTNNFIDDNDSDNDDDDDDDHKCTTCGTVTEKLYYCNRIDNQTMNCENNEKLCYNCNEHRWKLSCVKCKSWDCVDCIEFDREGGDLGTDFRSEVYALDPKACSKCKRIFCKECSNRCHRCKLCFCQEEQIHFYGICESCQNYCANNPERLGIGEEQLCATCANKDIAKFGYIKCPVCRKKLSEPDNS